MRKDMVVSRIFWLERKTKLFVKPAWEFAETVRKLKIFFATGSHIEGGTILPGKATRPPTKPVGQEVVFGLKIWPFRTSVLSQGLVAPVVGPNRREKSPFCNSACVGRVSREEVPRLFRYCSQEKKKKVLSLPL